MSYHAKNEFRDAAGRAAFADSTSDTPIDGAAGLWEIQPTATKELYRRIGGAVSTYVFGMIRVVKGAQLGAVLPPASTNLLTESVFHHVARRRATP